MIFIIELPIIYEEDWSKVWRRYDGDMGMYWERDGGFEEGLAVWGGVEEWRGWRYLYCFMVSMDGEFSPSVCIDLLGGGADR